jgi:hypothetical protein
MTDEDIHLDDHTDDEPVAPCPALPAGTRREADDDDPVIEPDVWPARPLMAPVEHVEDDA